MPLPWKKAKGKSFSQLLTNQFAPPKRGASLVVETGFPTSLADLFVKNSNRFKNNVVDDDDDEGSYKDIFVTKRKKKKKKNEASGSVRVHEVSSSSDLGIMEPRQSYSRLSGSSICAPLTPPRLLSIPQIPRDVAVDDWIVASEAVDRNDKNREVAKGKDVFMAILKMFFVVMLALGANKFAVGIALSAFFLLFLEYLGRVFGGSRLVQFLERHNNLSVILESCGIKLQKGEIQVENDSNLVSSKGATGMKNLNEEIQVENNCYLVSSKSSSGYRSSFEMSDLAMEIHGIPKRVKEEKQEVVMYPSELLVCDDNITKKVSRRSKLKSKIKKFASKLNEGKKKDKKKKAKESKFDDFGYEHAKATNWEDVEREFEVVCDDDDASWWLPSIGEDSDDQIIAGDSISQQNSTINNNKTSSNNNNITNNDSNNNIIKDDKGRETKKLSSGGYFLILVIVLVGLMGSRFLALVFALSWFFLLKTGLGTRLRCITVRG